jgi:hypothetical protein
VSGLIFGTLPPKADEEDDRDHDPPQQDRSAPNPSGPTIMLEQDDTAATNPTTASSQ